MKRVKLILVISFTLFTIYTGFAQQSVAQLWQEAEKYYAEQQYDKAAEIYAQICEFGESAPLYYNYANALFKSNQLGKAILYYERALQLDPSNADIKNNLEFAYSTQRDKIDVIQPFFAKKWLVSLGNLFNSNVWAYISIVSFIITLILIMLYLFGRLLWIRKAAFFTAFVALFITIVSFSYAFYTKNKVLNNSYAIVMSGSVTLKSSPDISGTDMFNLHEGAKVNVKQELSGWSEVSISDGRVGWLPTSDIENI